MKQIDIAKAFKTLGKIVVVLLIITIIIYIEWLTYPTDYNDNPRNLPPHLIFANGVSYLYDETYYRGENPAGDEIIGTVDSLVDAAEFPTKNGQTNVPECLGQPYAVRDGKLLIRRGKQLERPVKNDDGTWRTEYYYIWYICEAIDDGANQYISESESQPQPESSAPESSAPESSAPESSTAEISFESEELLDTIYGFGAIYKNAASAKETRKELIEGENGTLSTVIDVPATVYWITDVEGHPLIDHPFNKVDYANNMPDWGGLEDTPKEYLKLPVVVGLYKGDFYRYYFVDGAFVLDAHDGYSCYDPRSDSAAYDYKYTVYYYVNAGCRYGLTDSK